MNMKTWMTSVAVGRVQPARSPVGASSAREAFTELRVREQSSLLQRTPVHSQSASCRQQFACAYRGQRRRGANDWLLLAIMLACLLISQQAQAERLKECLLYTSPSPRD